jgi:lipopolysaccharide transport system ATP-binding protein
MTAIVAEEISKRYRINIGPPANTLGARVRSLFKRGESTSYEDLWALRDVSFEVEQGEVFGIIGRNGSGKSTLLKILTGIVRPTHGSAIIRGRVGALLEVGTGFHPDLTGRENVFFNGTLLGLDRAFIQSKLDEIVAFAEVEKFIDTQFKHYSSGMQARLGFAVAVNLRPEVLILDEVLSVGDLMFQEKSMDRVTELRKSGITILFVSHSLSAVAGICKRAMLIKDGKVVKIGEVGQVVEEYIPKPEAGAASVSFGGGSHHPGCFMEASLENADGQPADRFDITEGVSIRVRYKVKKPLETFVLGLRIHTSFEDIVVSYMTDENEVIGTHEVGIFEKVLKLNPMFLKEGDYSITLECGVPRLAFDVYDHALKFSVFSQTLSMVEKSYRRDRSGKVICQGRWHDADTQLCAKVLV